MKKFDAIVIGSGQAGIPLAEKLAKAGKKVAIIEKRWIGGTCINDGCTPTKTMIASARVAYLTKNGKHWGVETDGVKINYKTVMARKNEIVQSFKEGAKKGLENTPNLKVIFGDASFIDDHKILIKSANEETEIEGDLIFINTGCSPFIPDIDGTKETEYLTSTSLLELEEVPAHLIMVGGGYISLEMGQMMRRFGAKVTILEKGKTLLTKEDDDVCEVITDVFKKEGIEIHKDAKVTAISGKKEKKVTATINGKEKTFTGSHILIASGRAPQTKTLNLSSAGVETDERGFVKVNEKLKTTAQNIYALGDVKGGPEFTHISYNDFVIVSKNLLEKGNLTTTGRPVPYCMFTDPQLGRVGLSEKQAKEKGIKYKVAKLPMNHVARALETGETEGYIKAIIDPDSKQILGAAVVGTEGGELMSILQIAMLGNITYEQIRYNIFAHPLYAESLNNLFMSFD
ncbi:MAG: mercuric reductase [Chryseobacterium sp.]|nr:mercuric reductase [Chryseobacterium sp.]